MKITTKQFAELINELTVQDPLVMLGCVLHKLGITVRDIHALRDENISDVLYYKVYNSSSSCGLPKQTPKMPENGLLKVLATAIEEKVKKLQVQGKKEKVV